MTDAAAPRSSRRAWSFAGAAIAVAGFAWIFSRLDLQQLGSLVAKANVLFLALVPLAVVVEQWVRAWKWRQILRSLKPIGTTRLFGAIMSGYFASLLAPVIGVGPLVRAWLISRLEGLPTASVLASVAVDRFVDALVFVAIAAYVIVFAVFPDPQGRVRLGLIAGVAASVVLLELVLAALWHQKRQIAAEVGWLLRLADRLPLRFAQRARVLLVSFADGILWPGKGWRRAAIVLAGVLIKLIAASHILWAGLAFGVLLHPLDYLYILALLGFFAFVAHVARVPGGFLLGAVFALDQFGVGEERALAIAMTVFVSSIAAVAA
ncbi:MAG: lysylphosphatidylglycerol synthase transmembrane domain-containing protein, partial [Burkholderiales bacterium]